MEKFDLGRALAGEPIVDVKGREYLEFKLENSCSTLPYRAFDKAGFWSFNEKGECLGAQSRNLFMKHSKQNTMKPFDLEAAKKGDLVINLSRPNDTGVYLTTLKISEKDNDIQEEIYRHIFVFTRLDNSQYVTHCKDDGSSITFGIPIGDGVLSMAPKKVKYYFASWERNLGDPGDRASTQLFLRKEILIKEMEREGDYHIHEIEIEE